MSTIKPTNPADMLKLFRSGMDTLEIANLIGGRDKEAHVLASITQARNDERARARKREYYQRNYRRDYEARRDERRRLRDEARIPSVKRNGVSLPRLSFMEGAE